VRILLSGYYGYDNAGDEAVLAAMLDHLSTRVERAEFIVTSGDPRATETRHAGEKYGLRAVPRDDFKTLWHEIKSCDLFLSGGGSLLQDATSLRNIVYYTTLIRLAHLARKPAMVYAQGIGPLRRRVSQKLTRAALQSRSTRAITVRDPDSKALLGRIGVRRAIEVTTDPVWALNCELHIAHCKLDSGATSPINNSQCAMRNSWCVSLRSWLDASTPDAEAKLLRAIRDAAQAQNATLKFLAMQPARDGALLTQLGIAKEDVLPTENLHPRAIMKLAGDCDLMIGMRLHALIFAAAQGVPCVAVSYDPKVKSLAKLIGAPVIENASDEELAKLQSAVTSAPMPSTPLIAEMQSKALFNAELAAQLI
jgi:polysaccharide pyruvyl transferase CsaB